MDTAQWPQVVGLMKSKEEIAPDTCSKTVLEKRVRPQDQALNCPRCSSTNTKFCYFNNYSLTQPRCLRKTCRRYWTEGGSLRNVPVGGGSRKNKRSTSSSSSTSFHKFPDHLNPPGPTQFSSQNLRIHEGQDYLNLAFPATHGVSQFVKLPKVEANNHNFSSSSPLSALEVLLKTGTASRGFNSFGPTLMPNSNALYTSVFPLPEFKPTSCLSADGLGSSR